MFSDMDFVGHRQQHPTGSLSAEEEHALQERGRKLLEARLSDPNAPAYSAADMAALQQRGRGLLQAHQKQRAASRDSSPEHYGGAVAQGDDNEDSYHAHRNGDFAKRPTAAATLVEPLQQQQLAKEAAMMAKMQAELQQLRHVVAEQQQQLLASTSLAAKAAEEETDLKVQETKTKLVEQFNAHMAECEKANASHWAAMMQQHEAEVAALVAELTGAKEALALTQAQAQQHSTEQLQELEVHYAALEEEKQQLSQLADSLRDALAAEQQASAEARDELVRSYEELEALRATLTTLQDNSAEALRQADAARVVLAECEQAHAIQVEEIRGRYEAAEAVKSGLQTELERAQMERDTERQRAAELEEEVDALTRQQVDHHHLKTSEEADFPAPYEGIESGSNTNPFAFLEAGSDPLAAEASGAAARVNPFASSAVGAMDIHSLDDVFGDPPQKVKEQQPIEDAAMYSTSHVLELEAEVEALQVAIQDLQGTKQVLEADADRLAALLHKERTDKLALEAMLKSLQNVRKVVEPERTSPFGVEEEAQASPPMTTVACPSVNPFAATPSSDGVFGDCAHGDEATAPFLNDGEDGAGLLFAPGAAMAEGDAVGKHNSSISNDNTLTEAQLKAAHARIAELEAELSAAQAQPQIQLVESQPQLCEAAEEGALTDRITTAAAFMGCAPSAYPKETFVAAEQASVINPFATSFDGFAPGTVRGEGREETDEATTAAHSGNPLAAHAAVEHPIVRGQEDNSGALFGDGAEPALSGVPYDVLSQAERIRELEAQVEELARENDRAADELFHMRRTVQAMEAGQAALKAMTSTADAEATSLGEAIAQKGRGRGVGGGLTDELLEDTIEVATQPKSSRCSSPGGGADRGAKPTDFACGTSSDSQARVEELEAQVSSLLAQLHAAGVSVRETSLPAAAAAEEEEEDTHMQDFGRQFAEAQLRLMLSEEARQALELELRELRRVTRNASLDDFVRTVVTTAGAADCRSPSLHGGGSSSVRGGSMRGSTECPESQSHSDPVTATNDFHSVTQQPVDDVNGHDHYHEAFGMVDSGDLNFYDSQQQQQPPLFTSIQEEEDSESGGAADVLVEEDSTAHGADSWGCLRGSGAEVHGHTNTMPGVVEDGALSGAEQEAPRSSVDADANVFASGETTPPNPFATMDEVNTQAEEVGADEGEENKTPATASNRPMHATQHADAAAVRGASESTDAQLMFDDGSGSEDGSTTTTQATVKAADGHGDGEEGEGDVFCQDGTPLQDAQEQTQRHSGVLLSAAAVRQRLDALLDEAADRLDVTMELRGELIALVADAFQHHQSDAQRSSSAGGEEGEAEGGALSLTSADADTLGELNARNAALEAELRTMAEQHEAELQELADAAAAQLTETEELCEERVHYLEEQLSIMAAAAQAQPVQQDSIVIEEDVAPQPQGEEEEDLHLAIIDAAEEASSLPGSGPSFNAEPQENADCTTSLEEELQRLRESLADKEAVIATLLEQHEEEMQGMADQLSTHLTEHEELLRQKLVQQRDHYEALLEEAWREASASEKASEEGGAQRVTEGSTDSEYWHAEHDKLAERFSQLQAEYEAFMRDTEGLRERQNAQQEVQRQSDETARLAQHDATAQHISELRGRVEAMSRHMEALQADLSARDAQLEELQTEQGAALSALNKELVRTRNELEDRVYEVKQLTTANEELTQLLEDGATRVEEALTDQQNSFTKQQDELAQCRLQFATAQDHLARRDAALEAAKQQEEAMELRVVELESTCRDLHAQLDAALKACEDTRKGTVQHTERAARELDETRQELQKQAEREAHLRRREAEAARAELDAVREELHAAQTVAATLPLEEQRFKSQFDALKQQLAEAGATNKQLSGELRECRNELQRCQGALRRGSASSMRAAPGSGAAAAAEGADESAVDARMNTLLARNDVLEERLRAAQEERNALLGEKDALIVEARRATSALAVKEQAMKRQESELRHARAQLIALKEDLSDRVRTVHAQNLQLEHASAHAAELAAAYEELQQSAVDVAAESTIIEHSAALLEAKAQSIPRLLEGYAGSLLGGYMTLMQTHEEGRALLAMRCDAIERTTQEALIAGEKQGRQYALVLAEAQQEQLELKEIIEGQAAELAAAGEACAAALAETKTLRSEVADVRRGAHEDVFQAQRELQLAQLEHADTLNQLKLLQDELNNVAKVVERQKEQYSSKQQDTTLSLERALAEAEAQEARHRGTRERDAAEKAELQTRAEQAEAAREAATNEVRVLKAQLERALPRLAQLEEERAVRNAELVDTAQQYSALSRRTSSEEAVTRRHIDELNQTMQELLLAHASLQKSNTTNEAFMDRLKAQLADAEQQRDGATARVTQLEAELTKVLRKLDETAQQHQRETTGLASQLRDTERRLRGLEQRNEALAQEHRSAQDQCYEIQSLYDRSAHELQRAQEQLESQAQTLGRQLGALKERCTTLEAEVAELSQVHQKTLTERDAVQREARGANKEVEKLQRFLDDANRHNSLLNTELCEAKASHDAELDQSRAALTSAHKELAKCRKIMTEAEVRQGELQSALEAAQHDVVALRNEVAGRNTEREGFQTTLRKERFERQEMATQLQEQLAGLYEELRGKHDEIKTLEHAIAALRDNTGTHKAEIREWEERHRALKHEHETLVEQSLAAREQHRRERYDLQSKLNDAEDALAEAKRAQAQNAKAAAAKLEAHAVAEQALRQEVSDLQSDITRLEANLAVSTQGAQSAESSQSRQSQAIKALEREVQQLRAQASRDVEALGQLKVRLQQSTIALERAQADAESRLAEEKVRLEAEHARTCDALTSALSGERAAIREARSAREKALASMEQKQAELEKREVVHGGLQAQLRDTRREGEVLRQELEAIASAAGLAAREMGLREDDGDDEYRQDAGTVGIGEVQEVIGELLERLNMYALAANTLELEDQQVDELRTALAQQQDLMATVHGLIMGGGDNTSGAITAPLGATAAAAATGLRGATPTRMAPAAASPALVNSRPPSLTPNHRLFTGATAYDATNADGAPLGSDPRILFVLQQVEQESRTFGHRVEDHLRAMQLTLRALVAGICSGDKALSPIMAKQKLQITTVTAELHRRTAILSRILSRVADATTSAPSFVAPGGSLLGGVTPLRGSSPPPAEPLPSGGDNGSAVLLALQEAVRVFTDTEHYVLRPFNELLVNDDGSYTATGTAPFFGESADSYSRGSARPSGGNA